MSAFHDETFPRALSRAAKVSVVYANEIVTLSSGQEIRNARWAGARRKYEIGGAIVGAEWVNTLVHFFEARRGNLYSFRFRDETDYSSGGDVPAPDDQLLGIGDGAKQHFQLSKQYGSVSRAISKPVPGSVRVSVDGAETSAFSINHLTGEVTLETAPAEGSEIRAGFLFDVPVRFESAALDLLRDAGRAARAINLSFLEVKE